MRINNIKIENLRNIRNAEIKPKNKLNVITGDNGAGKTTLLESIYLLARAKSFRQSRNGRLINDCAKQLNLFATLESESRTKHKIGFQKDSTQTLVRKDGERVKKLSELAKTLPIAIITPNIQRIIEEDPENRRRLLNWGLFHVEQEYAELANRFRKILLQRNNALRSSADQLKVWDRQLVQLGSDIYQKMVTYTELWNSKVEEMIESIELIDPIQLELKPGWKEELTFAEALERNIKTDKERGFTCCGPHRIDLRILQNGINVKNRYSRGEAKITAIILLLSQALITEQRTNESPILLVDDLHSELDSMRYNRILNQITTLNIQSFITTLQNNQSKHLTNCSDCRVFHVEHGEVDAQS